MVVAAGLTAMAGAWAARDGADRLRPSLAALIATTIIGYALGQVLGEASLTAAIALMAAGAARLDRRFDLPLLGWFVVLAAPFVAWRLTVLPGLDWHVDAPLLPVLASLGASVAGFALAWLWLGGRGRAEPGAVAETAALSAAGYAVTVLLWRLLVWLGADAAHMAAGLTATVWLALACAQYELYRRGARFPWLRQGLAGLFAAVGGVSLVSGVTVLNPLLDIPPDNAVSGVAFLNTLAPGYLLPGLLLLLAGRHFRSRLILALGAASTGLWAVLAIRHAWRGPGGMSIETGASDGEITSYTVAMLLLGAALFYQGVAKRSDLWRRAGTVVLAVTAAKVFLVDASSLGELVRVGAFVALAFVLLGLAWLNRWAGGTPAPGSATTGPVDPSEGRTADDGGT